MSKSDRAPEELGARYAEVGRWFAKHGARLGHSNRLAGPDSAAARASASRRGAGG